MKRQVLTGSKLCATVLSMILALQPILAQAQTPEITVTIFRDLVRFAAPSDVQEMRVEVFNSTAEKIFDSNFVAGQTQDWSLQDLQGNSVESGLYAYTVTVKDQGGALRQMQRGNLIVDREREGLEAAPPIDPSQARPSESIQPQPAESWDVDHPQNPYIINSPAMGIGTRNPFARLHIGAGTAEPITKGSTLLLEEGEATGMVLKSTTGAEMFFSQDKKYGLFGTASNHPMGIRTNNQNRLWVSNEGNVGIGTTNPGSPLTVAGVIETTGGIKFPDGTIQTSAASGVAGDQATPGQKNAVRPTGKEGATPNGVDGNWSLAGNAITAGQFLGTTNGQPLVIKTGSAGVLSEAMRIDTFGNVVIGILSPAISAAGISKLRLSVPASSSPIRAMSIDVESFGTEAKAQASHYFRVRDIGAGSTPFYIRGDGNVGIGTANPDSKLTLDGDIHLTSGAIKFPDGTTQTTRGISAVVTECCSTLEGAGTSTSPLRVRSPLLLTSGVSSETISGVNTNIFPTGVGVYGQANRGSGVKGVGITGRGVWGQNINPVRIGDQPGVYGSGDAEDGGQFVSTAGNGVFAQGANYGAYVVGTEFGVYGESNSASGFGGLFTNTIPGGIALRVDGQTSTSVLQITGGSDLSEQFDVKAAPAFDHNALPQQVQPGLVVSIDPDNPGKLVISSQAYDHRVAGIISGAGGIKTGMLMGQSGSIADGSHPVALTGRVYCWADATRGPIIPGDLLTTSDLPGYAMKVADREKAQGAIIGKAMTGLKQGKGLVLVLVTLK